MLAACLSLKRWRIRWALPLLVEEGAASSTLEERAGVGRRGAARSEDATWTFIV